MGESINTILNDKISINTLLQKNKSVDITKTMWIAPSDKSTSIIIVDGSELKDLTSILRVTRDVNSGLESNLLRCSPIVYPTQVPLCPSIDTIKDRFFLDNLIVTVHSLAGYNFSSEYTNVYKATYNKLNVYDDLSAVIRRTLKALDPTMIEVFTLKYADYMIRTAAWESSLAHSVAVSTINGMVASTVSASSKWKDTDFYHVKIYVGRSADGELVFHLRIRVQIEVMEEIGEPTGTPTTGTSGKVKKSKSDALSKQTLEFVYYREFKLTNKALDEFDQTVYVKSGSAKGLGFVPPPPPSRAKKGSGQENEDIRLFLVIPNDSNGADKATPTAAAAIVDPVVVLDPAAPRSRADSDSDGEDKTKGVNVAADESGNRMKVRATKKCDASFCSELVVWGFNSANSMCVESSSSRTQSSSSDGSSGGPAVQSSNSNEDKVMDPRAVPVPYSIAVERVSMIACSANHTLILTHMGTVYGCGDNTEGALGLKDLVSRDSLTLIDFPPLYAHPTTGAPPKITKISAGCTTIGAHSMAVDVEGALYGWGVAYAVGKGIVKPVSEPTRIDLIPPSRRAGEVATTESIDADNLLRTDSKGNRISEVVVDVSCGGGFTLCVTQSGHVFSWGMWSHGRLGQGSIPMVTQARTARKREVKRLARYQLHPALVEGVYSAVKVACGEAHALCLLQCGSLLSWGQNSCGQLGCGPTFHGYMSDSFSPFLVPPFVNHAQLDKEFVSQFSMKSSTEGYGAALLPKNSVHVVDIACGAFHSVCLDADGVCYSWGARGSPCLGHNDAELVGEWSGRINSLFSISTAESKLMVPFELMSWCAQWSMPRPVENLRGISIEQISCGDLHSSFLSSNGRLYLCGSGPIVPGIVSTSMILEDAEDEDEDNRDVKGEDRETSRLKRKIKQAEQQSRLSSVIATPRSPSSCWMHELCTKQIQYICSGACKMFLVVDEETVSESLTASLLDQLSTSGGISDKQQQQLEDLSLSSHSDSSARIASVFESRGKADCMILASGKVFLCHKALLAQRSSELRNMIVVESPLDDSYSQPVQLLLPELQRDSARALLFYLYRDVLPKWSMGNASLLYSLARAAQNLRIPRLQLICERFLKLLHAGTKSSDKSIEETLQLKLEMPPSTLARDLGAMVGDPEFADVRFIAEGRAIVAHRFILESRCEYFRAMFRSNMGEQAVATYKKVVDVVVPDSFVGFLRLLLYIYTDTLPDGSDGALLEDLMAADRYDIPDMKLLCENMLVPTANNWRDLLRAADLLGSQRIQLLVTGFLRDNFSVLEGTGGSALDSSSVVTPNDGDMSEVTAANSAKSTQGEDIPPSGTGLAELKSEFPELLEELYELRKHVFPLPPSQVLVQQCASSGARHEAEKKVPVFPLWALCMAAASLFVYQYVSTVVSLGYVVPIVNSVGLVLLAVTAFKVLNKK